MSTLERAIVIAAEAHAGQLDKAGAPYVLHPLRVMLGLSSTDERIVGALHDVCEDCPGWMPDRLRGEGFPDHIIEAVWSVTKRDGEDYEAFVRRAAANPIGRRVKLADLYDNCDLSRFATPSEGDLQRVKKYRWAIDLINQTAGMNHQLMTLDKGPARGGGDTRNAPPAADVVPVNPGTPG